MSTNTTLPSAEDLDPHMAADMLEDQVRRFTNMAIRDGRRGSAREWAADFASWLDPDTAHEDCVRDLAFLGRAISNGW